LKFTCRSVGQEIEHARGAITFGATRVLDADLTREFEDL
jgi:hypothetical protein